MCKKNSHKLEIKYLTGTLEKTGKKYTTDSIKNEKRKTSFQPRQHIEYKYNGKKYIRITADDNCKEKTLSDGRIVKVGKPYWIEVEPIKWLVDKEKDIALTEKIIFAGIQFDDKKIYDNIKIYDGTYLLTLEIDKFGFEQKNIKKFMDEYFSKDIITFLTKETINIENQEEIYTIEASIEELKKQIEILPDSYQQRILKQIENVIDHGLDIYQKEIKSTIAEPFDPKTILKLEIEKIKNHLNEIYPYLTEIKTNIDELNNLKEYLIKDDIELLDSQPNLTYETLSNIKKNITIYPKKEQEKVKQKLITLINKLIQKYHNELKYDSSYRLNTIDYQKDLIGDLAKIEVQTLYKFQELNDINEKINNLKILNDTLFNNQPNDQSDSYLKDIVTPLKDEIASLNDKYRKKLSQDIKTIINDTHNDYEEEKQNLFSNKPKLTLIPPEANLKLQLIQLTGKNKTFQNIEKFNYLKRTLKR